LYTGSETGKGNYEKKNNKSPAAYLIRYLLEYNNLKGFTISSSVFILFPINRPEKKDDIFESFALTVIHCFFPFLQNNGNKYHPDRIPSY
jgi:hypothetical protein